jgi:hypothetical protein
MFYVEHPSNACLEARSGMSRKVFHVEHPSLRQTATGDPCSGVALSD